MNTPTLPVRPSPGSTPLWAAFLFTFVNSVGTGIITNGIYFVTEHGYGFSRAQNFLLGVLLGITYIAGAFAAGPLIRSLQRLFPSLTPRRVLLWLMVLMTLLAALPAVVGWILGVSPAQGPKWPVWVVVVLYSPLSGVLWPVVESYISGGRSAANLRGTIGRWNIVWSGAVALSYFGLAPLVKSSPQWALMLAAASHIVGIALLAGFAPRPAEHIHEDHQPHPPVYSELLVTFRWLLPLSYIVTSAIGPYLPGATASLGLSEAGGTLAAATWLVVRCVAFAGLERWHGWHGRWAMPVVGVGLLFVGFAAVVVAPLLPGGGLAALLGGLAVFGMGMATIYTGALYYAMEVGAAEVDAGGMHETLIGVGYTLGPACGLVAAVGVERAVIPAKSFELPMLAMVTVIGAGVTGSALLRVRRLSREGARREEPPTASP
jgi:hypothetical protein